MDGHLSLYTKKVIYNPLATCILMEDPAWGLKILVVTPLSWLCWNKATFLVSRQENVTFPHLLEGSELGCLRKISSETYEKKG